MTELKQIYKCNVCGNIVEVVHTGAGELVCCGQPMELKQEKIEDEGREKHVPVIEKTTSGVVVRVLIRWNRSIISNGLKLLPNIVPIEKHWSQGRNRKQNFSWRLSIFQRVSIVMCTGCGLQNRG